MQDLPVEIGQLHDILVHHREGTHTGHCKVDRDRGAKPPGPGNKDMGLFKTFLPFVAKEHHLAFISFAFAFREHLFHLANRIRYEDVALLLALRIFTVIV